MTTLHIFVISIVIILALFSLVAILLGKKWKSSESKLSLALQESKDLKEKFSDIIDAEEEALRIVSKAENTKQSLEAEQVAAVKQFEKDLVELKNAHYKIVSKLMSEKEQMESSFGKRKATLEERYKEEKSDFNESLQDLEYRLNVKQKQFDEIQKVYAIYNADVELAELGFYKPQFNWDDSDRYKRAINKVKEQQKDLIRLKNSKDGAFYCKTEWTVGSSKVEGRKMTERNIRLTSRAFNNECDSAIASCNWKNVVRMEERIKRVYDAINKMNESNQIEITRRYLDLKLKELRLTFEYKEQKQKEKEEQAEIREQMREEARVDAEIKRIEKEAVQEERVFTLALEKAKQELLSVEGEKRTRLEREIEKLQEALQEAEEKHKRAESMAQQTKQGHVYVISNVGSFGEDVYKIGMTRRLEPMDRVKELGDASVPFTFDVHAMIHTSDAPALERKLHDIFDSKRMNAVNRRKEFFEVTLDDIKLAIKNNFDEEVEFIETAVARDYNETKVIREQESMTFREQAA